MSFSDEEGRPPIPAELRRRVLVEAGHRCAIPTCRYIEVDVHHIIPWAKCKTHEYENLIALCPNCHRRADRDEIDRKSLRLYKSNLRFLHDKYSQLEMDVLFNLFQQEPNAVLPWPPMMMILLKRIIDAELVTVTLAATGVYMNGVKSSPDYLSLSVKGREYMGELGLQEL
ncbi:HNH endonuclease signature motif containing protein [Hyphomicrobium sp.]|uniref:HNH endonuclease n=1 Tax=Hyphomicrobium sp. TaxID=82 RepID=UPI000F9A3091|nr:HNH endonuclease signature motif containing protein [Hyphomicrobium sp.]RUP09053.1 MAG: HNH endonuclease [Hyphomicrobium sp.]